MKEKKTKIIEKKNKWYFKMEIKLKIKIRMISK